MPLLPSFRQLGFVLGGVLLATLAGCGKSHKGSDATAGKVTISGKVTYDRIPLLHDANGIPTVLETDPAKFELNLPARYITVSLYRMTPIFDPAFPKDLSKAKIFFGREGSAAVSDGTFSFTVDPNIADVEWMVEVQSSIHLGDSSSPADVNLVADPNGITSTVPQRNRLRYCIRKAPNGNLPSTSPGVNHVATSKVTADTTVDFHVGVNDSWFLADTDYDLAGGKVIPRLVPAYSPGLATASQPNGYKEAGQLEASPTGSRVLSILDAFVDMAAYLGTNGSLVTIAPGGPGTSLDLHYLKGRTEPKGTYIAWDRSQYPEGQAVDPNTSIATPTGFSAAFDAPTGSFHFFGSVRGGASNDDAWDRGPLITLAAQCNVFYQVTRTGFFAQSGPLGRFTPLPQGALLSNLGPQMALLEGLPRGIAAVILKNPYIADTSTGGTTYTNIRDLSTIPTSERSLYCAPLYSALIWELALGAKAIPHTENPTDWSNMVPATISPFVSLIEPFNYLDATNIYPQLKAMQSTLPSMTTTSPFTDAAIQDVLTYLGVSTNNLPWPRPSVGPLSTFVDDWGAEPLSNPPSPATSTITPILLSMSKATLVSGVYGNASQGELAFARFTISRTKSYDFDVQLPGGALTNGEVEVSFIGVGTPDGMVVYTHTFTNSTTTSIPLTFQAPTGATSTWLVRVRMLSPTTLQPDTTVQIKLVPAA